VSVDSEAFKAVDAVRGGARDESFIVYQVVKQHWPKAVQHFGLKKVCQTFDQGFTGTAGWEVNKARHTRELNVFLRREYAPADALELDDPDDPRAAFVACVKYCVRLVWGGKLKVSKLFAARYDEGDYSAPHVDMADHAMRQLWGVSVYNGPQSEAALRDHVGVLRFKYTSLAGATSSCMVLLPPGYFGYGMVVGVSNSARTGGLDVQHSRDPQVGPCVVLIFNSVLDTGCRTPGSTATL
jgi:hypothetical protein